MVEKVEITKEQYEEYMMLKKWDEHRKRSEEDKDKKRE